MNNVIYKGRNRTCLPDSKTIGDRRVWREGVLGRQGWGAPLLAAVRLLLH